MRDIISGGESGGGRVWVLVFFEEAAREFVMLPLFEMTKADEFFPSAATVEEADRLCPSFN
jgi:hypothetical protein